MTLVMGRWEARGGFRAAPRLEKKSDLSSFGDLRYYTSVDEVDLVLEISWANDCAALDVQVVSSHCGRLP